jgi:hypothetical protein
LSITGQQAGIEPALRRRVNRLHGQLSKFLL